MYKPETAGSDTRVSGFEKRLKDLEKVIQIRKELERIPKCKLKDALLEEVESFLNPPDKKEWNESSSSMVKMKTSPPASSSPFMGKDTTKPGPAHDLPKNPRGFVGCGVVLFCFLFAAILGKGCT